MSAKLNIRARAPPAVVVGLLLATCLLLAATVANASRPLKVSSSEEDGAHTAVVESPPVGHIVQTVVLGSVEQDGGAAGHRLMNVAMLAGIKDSGPSPGAGH